MMTDNSNGSLILPNMLNKNKAHKVTWVKRLLQLSNTEQIWLERPCK